MSPALSLFLVIAVLLSVGVPSAAEPATLSGTAFRVVAIETDPQRGERETIEGFLKATYSDAPRIEALSLDPTTSNLQEILGSYLERSREQMIDCYEDDQSGGSELTVFVGDIVHVVDNTASASHTQAPRRAVYFIPRLGNRRPIRYNRVVKDHGGRPTAYIDATALPIVLSADRAASQPDTSFALIELENYESTVLAQNLRARYSHVPNIEELTLWNLQEILGAYLEKHEDRMIAWQAHRDESGDIYFTFFVGDIVHVADETVEVKNPALSDVVGEELGWHAVFFIPRFGTRKPENYNVVFSNHEGRPTAYTDVTAYPIRFDAHEAMHIWQSRRADWYRTTPISVLEFQAIAFHLAYDAYSEDLYSLRQIERVMGLTDRRNTQYPAGQFLIWFFRLRGIQRDEILQLTHEQREEYGIRLFRAAMRQTSMEKWRKK